MCVCVCAHVLCAQNEFYILGMKRIAIKMNNTLEKIIYTSLEKT